MLSLAIKTSTEQLHAQASNHYWQHLHLKQPCKTFSASNNTPKPDSNPQPLDWMVYQEVCSLA